MTTSISLAVAAFITAFIAFPTAAKEPSPSRLRYAPDGSILAASARGRPGIILYDAKTLERLTGLDEKGSPIGDIDFGADARTLATGAGDRVRVWDLDTFQEIAVFPEEPGTITSIAYSHTGSLLAAGNFRGTLQVWNARQSQLLWTYNKRGPFSVEAVAFSPDERRIAFLLDDTYLRVWDVATQEQKALFRGDLAATLAFSPDGRVLAAGSQRTLAGKPEYAARLWDIASGAQIGYLPGHTDRIESINFSADGSLLVTAGRDSTVRLWAWDSGQPVAVFRGHQAPVGTAAFSPDDLTIASVDWQGQILLWDWNQASTAVEPTSWGTIKNTPDR
ncbi:MAG: hypothetical protein GKR89_09680 [Candidatus Latescibacteria bacterium]|nr:hypothetical protein [Candidatus Latescibacterota bacterium]